MVQWPGKIPEGKTYDRPVVTCDIFATTFAAAQIAMPKDRKLDSVNLLPYIKGKKTVIRMIRFIGDKAISVRCDGAT